ncbi:hypothetical protein D3C87_1443050 [compost metagenome]
MLVVFEQFEKVHLLRGLLRTPVRQRVTAGREQSQTIGRKCEPQLLASRTQVLCGLRQAGEDRGSDFDLPLEHLKGKTLAQHRLARVDRRAGGLAGHAPGIQVGDEVFLFDAKLQVSVHPCAPQ